MDGAATWATVLNTLSPLGRWIVVALLGVFVATGELVARHRDAPGRALLARPALAHLGLDAIASMLALALIEALGWVPSPNATAAGAGSTWLPVLAAGIGAMAILRTSFTLGTGDNRFTISLNVHLQRFLDAANNDVDRVRGEARSQIVQAAVQGALFTKSHKALPLTCFQLVPHIPVQEQTDLNRDVEALAEDPDLNDHVKMLILGLRLLDLVGEGVLRAAITALGDDIK